MVIVRILNSKIDDRHRHETETCRFRSGWECLHSDFRGDYMCTGDFCLSRFTYEDRQSFRKDRLGKKGGDRI